LIANGTSQPSWIKGEIESIIQDGWNQELGENRKHISIIKTTKDDLLFFF
jgi:hypothetical protein